MSEEQLYQLARQSIDRKNRRWLLWGIHLIAFLLYVGAFTAFGGIPRNLGEFMLQAWFALLVLHSTALVLMQDQEAGIDGEVAKLRQALHEKPKRHEFSDYGDYDDYGALSESVETANPRSSHN
jgi:hypothetical protein